MNLSKALLFTKYILTFIIGVLVFKLLLELNSFNDDFVYKTNQYTKSQVRLQKYVSEEAHFKVLIQYIHTLDAENDVLIENFKYFMTIGVLPCHSNADFRIILKTKFKILNLYEELGKIFNDTVLINDLELCKNVKIILNENNSNYLCTQLEHLNRSHDGQIYKYYFFINSTVRGPFLPNYWTQPWWKIFTNKFGHSLNLAATGPYILVEPNKPFVQSFFIVVNKKGFEIFEKTLNNYCSVFNEVDFIKPAELKIGENIYKSGYEIEGLLTIENNKKKLEDYAKIRYDRSFLKYPMLANFENTFVNNSRIQNCNCSYQFMKYEYYSINIFEITWVLFYPQAYPITNYIKKYLPVYTQIQYDNKYYLNSKKKANFT